jgi:hypothetical protein
VPIAFEKTNKFLNSREWRTFLSSVSSASYPRVVGAVRAGHAWLSGGAFGAPGAASLSGGRSNTHSGWLLVEGSLVTDPGETLGI